MRFQRLQEILEAIKGSLTHRDDGVESDVQANVKELENHLKIQGFPIDLEEKVKEVVKYYWGVFCEDGFHRPIRFFLLHIDTGNHPPIFYKPTRYRPQKSEFM